MKMKLLISILFAILLGWQTSNAQVPPTLLSPQNLDSCQSRFLTLKWEPVPNAISYRVEISDTVNFQRLVISQANITITNLDVILNDWQKKYFWRVYSVYPGGTEGKSSEWVFKTKKPPVLLVSIPNETVCVDTNAQFLWRKADAEFYTLQISEDSLFSNIYYQKDNLIDTVASVKIPYFNKTMYWRVAAKKGLCLTDWSDVWSFTTKQSSPTLLSPINGAKGADIFATSPFKTTLIWSNNPDASTYDIQVSDSPTFETFYTQASTADTSYQINLESNYDSLFYWRVRSYVNDCYSYWSQPFKIRTPYNKPTPTLPLNEESCVSMSNNIIKWTVIPGATQYTLEVTSDSNFVENVNQVKNINEIQSTVQLDKSLSKYYWRVRGEDSKNIGLWSNIYTFYTTQRPPSTFVPANNSVGTVKSLTLSWENFGANTYYDVKLASDKDLKHLIIDTTLLDTNYLPIQVPDNNSSYFWSVRVRTGSCLGDWSSVQQFKTIINTPQLISPENASIEESLYPIFTWNNVEDAINYEIEVSLDSNFATLFKYNRDLTINTMTFAGEAFKEKTTYYWRVRAKNSEGKSQWSQVYYFTIKEQVADAPTLLFPINGETKLPKEFSFLWSTKANALSYDIEVATDYAFTNVIVNDIVADTIYSIVGLENFKNYYWRVRSINDGGIGNWSHIFSFRTKDEAPTEITILTYPNDAQTELPITFVFAWDSVNRALYYHLQIANNNTFEESSIVFNFDKVYDTTKKISGLEYTKKYYWRVRAENEDGEGPWSAVRSFETFDISSVEDNDLYLNDISVSPNPANNYININFNIKGNELGQLKIYNMIGTELYSSNKQMYYNGANSIKVNTDNYQAGLYIYNLTINNKTYKGSFIVK